MIVRAPDPHSTALPCSSLAEQGISLEPEGQSNFPSPLILTTEGMLEFVVMEHLAARDL